MSTKQLYILAFIASAIAILCMVLAAIGRDGLAFVIVVFCGFVISLFAKQHEGDNG